MVHLPLGKQGRELLPDGLLWMYGVSAGTAPSFVGKPEELPR